jgi:hypothetical protein
MPSNMSSSCVTRVSPSRTSAPSWCVATCSFRAMDSRNYEINILRKEKQRGERRGRGERGERGERRGKGEGKGDRKHACSKEGNSSSTRWKNGSCDSGTRNLISMQFIWCIVFNIASLPVNSFISALIVCFIASGCVGA